MNSLITQFKPIHGFFTPTLLLCLFILAGALAFLFFNTRRAVAYKERNTRNLLSLLAMFIGLFAFGFGGFEVFLNRGVKQISLYENGLDLPKGEVKFSEVRNIYIFNAKNTAISAGQKVKRGEKVLVVEQYDGKNHFLLEKDYDIQTMIKPIRQQFDKYKK